MQLFFHEYGAGHPLIILHGLLGSLDNWHTLSTIFARSFRVIAVDQRNHGRSRHSEEMTYEAMAQDIVELLDRLDLSTAHVLGHSMGGKSAMQLALRHRQRISKLIVVDIAPRAYPPLHDEIFEALLSVNLAALESRQQVDEALAVSIGNRAIRQFLMKNLARNPAGGFSWRPDVRALKDNYSLISAEITDTRPFPRPTLFVKGSRSPYISESDKADILRLFPKAEIVSVEAGHWVHADAPEPFAAAVMSFLNAADAS